MIDRVPGPVAAMPPEVERLLNSAYCACVLARCARAYEDASSGQRSGLPYPLAHLCLPLALYAPAWEAVNGHTRGYGLHRFVHAHSDLLVDLPARVTGLAATTREAVLFGATHGLLRFDTDSGSVIGVAAISRRLTAANLDVAAMEPVRAAERLGSWFAQVSPPEVFLYLGLQP